MATQSNTSHPIETDHQDMIHDAQLNWFGTRLATCSSDRTIKIFDINTNESTGATSQTLVDTLRGHEGPVWQVSWAHPKFGNILASCSYDGKVFVWRQGATQSAGPNQGAVPVAPSNSSWQKIKEHTLHNASVNSIAWAPHELGAPMLACASSDGKVSVLTFNDDGTWDASLFTAHPVGANSITWAPATLPGALIRATPPQTSSNPNATQTQQQQSQNQGQYQKKFATGGCDSVVKIWAWKNDTKSWFEEEQLEGHSDWVRDVAWQPSIGLPRTYLASASQDKTVIIHINDAAAQQGSSKWTQVVLDPQNSGSAEGSTFPDTVWRVSWSIAGGVLAVSCGDGKITLWKENLKGKFELVSDMEANS